MKKSEVKLINLCLLSSFCLLFNIFIKNIFTDYLMVVFLMIVFGITYYMVGYEQGKNQYSKRALKFVLIYTIAFLVLIYGLGLLVGYLKNSYSLNPLNILKNTLPEILIIVIGEFLRCNLCKKGSNNKYVLVLIVFMFVLVDIGLSVYKYDLSGLKGILGILTIEMIPSVFKNILLTFLGYKYGYLPGMAYSLVMGLYGYIMPIVPNLNDYLKSITMFLVPLAVLLLTYDHFKNDQEEDDDPREKHYGRKVINGLLVILLVMMIGLFSNLFRYWIAAVGSGSMVPTINVGDAIIVDKDVKKNLDKLQVGEILVFKIRDTIYTHRVVEIKKVNGEYAIITKGDREGQAVDTWVVTNNDVVGVVKFKIPYVGWPTVWLSRMVG